MSYNHNHSYILEHLAYIVVSLVLPFQTYTNSSFVSKCNVPTNNKAREMALFMLSWLLPVKRFDVIDH